MTSPSRRLMFLRNLAGIVTRTLEFHGGAWHDTGTRLVGKSYILSHEWVK